MNSELVGVLHALNLAVVLAAEGLVHVVLVGNVLGALNLVAVGVTLGQNDSAGDLVLLHHLDAEDVVDFDVMRGETVVQEVWWEHHVVTLVPEFWVVLSVEVVQVTAAHEAEAGENNHGSPHPHEHTGNVDWTLGHAEETGRHWSHHGDCLVAENPVPVHHLHHTAERVLSHLALTEGVEASESSDSARALRETLIN